MTSRWTSWTGEGPGVGSEEFWRLLGPTSPTMDAEWAAPSPAPSPGSSAWGSPHSTASSNVPLPTALTLPAARGLASSAGPPLPAPGGWAAPPWAEAPRDGVGPADGGKPGAFGGPSLLNPAAESFVPTSSIWTPLQSWADPDMHRSLHSYPPHAHLQTHPKPHFHGQHSAYPHSYPPHPHLHAHHHHAQAHPPGLGHPLPTAPFAYPPHPLPSAARGIPATKALHAPGRRSIGSPPVTWDAPTGRVGPGEAQPSAETRRAAELDAQLIGHILEYFGDCHGSLPSERVQNIIKKEHRELYDAVFVSARFGKKWHKFLNHYSDTFQLFTVPSQPASDQDYCWRIRLTTNQDWEEADQQEEERRGVAERAVLERLHAIIAAHPEGECPVAEIIHELNKEAGLEDASSSCDDGPGLADRKARKIRVNDLKRIMRKHPSDVVVREYHPDGNPQRCVTYLALEQADAPALGTSSGPDA